MRQMLTKRIPATKNKRIIARPCVKKQKKSKNNLSIIEFVLLLCETKIKHINHIIQFSL